jgi:Leucine-rich repeat (LRR) protein
VLLHALTLAQAEGGKRPTGPDDVIWLNLECQYCLTDAGLKELKDFKNLKYLNLSQDNVTEAGLKELKGLKHLRTLVLSNTHVMGEWTDGVLRTLREIGLLHALREAQLEGGQRPSGPDEVFVLYLSGYDKMTDAGLKELKDLKNLQMLDLARTKVTGVGLKEFKNLQTLDLSNTQVSEEGLKELKGCKNLKYLNLKGTAVTDEGLKELKGLKNLRTLYLPVVTDGVLRSLREVGLLHALANAQAEGGKRPAGDDDMIYLDLSGTQVTNEGLKELKDLKNLRVLSLLNTKVTDEGLKELKEALPMCMMHR